MITDYLNPGQVPIMTFDQPLFALAKLVQWKWPDIFGENKFLVMFGGLHIEMALWNTIGDFLEGSGWNVALTEAGVATAGKSESFLKASHLTRTRRVHQVTLLALANLQREAWKAVSVSHLESNEEVSFQTWRQNMVSKRPTFQYWDLIMEFEIAVLIFIYAQRTKQFDLYVESMEQLVQWIFGLDHINYARWIPVHIQDMQSLPESISEQFQSCWVVQKTQNRFSSMPLDQSVQDLFHKHVQDLCATISDMGNPFLEKCPELLTLHTCHCASDSVIETVRTIKDVGLSQYKNYVKDVLVSRTSSIHHPINKNSLPLFKRPTPKSTKNRKKISSLKQDCNLFSHLYIASTFRGGDLEEFFSHENHPWPPSISDHGKLRLPAKKSEQLSFLGSETSQPPTQQLSIFCVLKM